METNLLRHSPSILGLGKFERLLDRYDGYGAALSVNTNALGASKWMQ
ncbi:MAG: hypothetical protein MKZ67_06715 [Acidimicrobiales bacterium]|nr:hypothetical protein [Acidimicrobiales bacterium]